MLSRWEMQVTRLRAESPTLHLLPPLPPPALSVENHRGEAEAVLVASVMKRPFED